MTTATQNQWTERKGNKFTDPLHVLQMGKWRLEIWQAYKSDVLVGKVKLDWKTVHETNGMIPNLLKTELMAWVYDRAREFTQMMEAHA